MVLLLAKDQGSVTAVDQRLTNEAEQSYNLDIDPLRHAVGPHGLRFVGFSFLGASILRAALYVDGFNLYHAIDDLSDDRLKWLSLHDLGQTIIRRKTETLAQVVYFSAFAHYRSAKDPSVVARHRQYVAALESTGVEVVMGNFKRKARECFKCRARWDSHEEKETDVNIAVRLVADAFQDMFDAAYVLSADTDLVPAMKCVRGIIGGSGVAKEVVAVFPPMQNRNVNALTQNSDRQIKLNRNHIAGARLQNSISLPDGSVLACPQKYV